MAEKLDYMSPERSARSGQYITVKKGAKTSQGQHYDLMDPSTGSHRTVVTSTASGTVNEETAKRFAKAIKKLART